MSIVSNSAVRMEDILKELQDTLKDIEYDDDERLKELTRLSENIFSKIVFLMRKERENNFFSYFLDKINIKIDYFLPAGMAVSFSNNRYNLNINPFIAYTEDKEIIKGMIIHELYHIIMNHLQRVKKYNKTGEYNQVTLNYGLDVAINQYIPSLYNATNTVVLEDGTIETQPKFITISVIAEIVGIKSEYIKTYANAEYYIELLKNSKMNKENPNYLREKLQELLDKRGLNKKAEGDKKEETNNKSNLEAESESENSEENEKKDKKEETNSSSNNYTKRSSTSRRKVVKRPTVDGDHSLSVDMDGEDDSYLNHMIKDLLSYAKSRSIGSTPDLVGQVMNELFQEPIIKWQNVLKNFMGRVPVPSKRTRARLSRRLPNRLDISGKLPDRLYNIVIAVDTSGSMSDEEIMLCYNEVWEIIAIKKKFILTVIECDAEVQVVYTVKKKTDFRKLLKEGRKGRGGTEFSPVYEYLRSHKQNFNDAIVVFFTDGGGERELTVKPLNNNNIWVLTDKANDLSVKKYYGKKLELRLNDIINKYK